MRTRRTRTARRRVREFAAGLGPVGEAAVEAVAGLDGFRVECLALADRVAGLAAVGRFRIEENAAAEAALRRRFDRAQRAALLAALGLGGPTADTRAPWWAVPLSSSNPEGGPIVSETRREHAAEKGTK